MNKKITTQKWSGIAFKVKNKLRQSLELWRSLTNYFILIRRSRIGKISVRKSLRIVSQALTNSPTNPLSNSPTFKPSTHPQLIYKPLILQQRINTRCSARKIFKCLIQIHRISNRQNIFSETVTVCSSHSTVVGNPIPCVRV